jgi:hypothetical protein
MIQSANREMKDAKYLADFLSAVEINALVY